MPLAKLNGININYKAEGQGEPLVMIMGFTANRSNWMPQIPFFKRFYRVITFDNRGVGKSDKPQGPYSTKMMADDTVRLMDLLGIKKAHIMGAKIKMYDLEKLFNATGRSLFPAKRLPDLQD
jgi:pimeloyl-ACP methyl ester carboxylesterase